MSRIVSVLSFRPGSGKTRTAANLAALGAQQGRTVGALDADLLSPSLHALFGLREEEIGHTLNDFLWERCALEEAVYDVAGRLDAGLRSRLCVVPASTKYSETARMERSAYDWRRLQDGIQELIERLGLDELFIDTHTGLHPTTLLPLAIADAAVILLRPDRQDYQGTGMIVELARKLDVPQIVLVVNEVGPAFALPILRRQLEDSFGCEVAAFIPYSDDVMAARNDRPFVLVLPDHPITEVYRGLSGRLTG